MPDEWMHISYTQYETVIRVGIVLIMLTHNILCIAV